MDVFLREYPGYTYRTLMADIEDHYEDWFVGALDTISLRNEIAIEQRDGVPMKKEDVGTKKGKRTFKQSMQKSDARMTKAHAALTRKFPHLM